LAEHPGRIKDLFLTKEKNDAGIHAVKLYIRGKPWIVEVDDLFLVLNPKKWQVSDKLGSSFAKPSKSGEMWAPILEKAWAKVKGSYENAGGGNLPGSFRMLTGAPVFFYETKDFKAPMEMKM